jgi:2-polyprenyl-3-methyl-5-hydroxy-6-metoxy-1,4-benzoquinol methylase
MAAIYEGRDYYVKAPAAAGGESTAGATNGEQPSQHDGHVHGYSSDYLADRAYIEAKFDRVLGHLERYVSPGRLLDIGAGPGFLLAVAKRRGWDAVGLDLNEWAVQYGRGELGVDLRLGALGPDSFPGEQFDAVTMMDLVEHVPSSEDLLRDVARVVRPGGAVALLTPDAGARVSRSLGHRWPEVVPGEHAVLFSVDGLGRALARHGFTASGWHTVGKEAPVATLLADAAPAAPGWVHRVRDFVAHRSLGERVVDVDPHTKFCLYARRLPATTRPPEHRPVRVPKRPDELAHIDEAIVDELGAMADAPRLIQWGFDAFGEWVPGAKVLEVGAGIGTFTSMMLDAGAISVIAMEPEPRCADVLDRTFADEPRVTVTRDGLPDAPSLAGTDGTFDLVVCHNVLEHIADDLGALQAMARALRPGGRLSLLVPSQTGLFGPLDDAYGHWRRYDRDQLAGLVADAGFEVESIRAQNTLGVAGWWTKNLRPGARIGAASFKAYEILVKAWRPMEERLHPRAGLSLVVTGVKPPDSPAGEAGAPAGEAGAPADKG